MPACGSPKLIAACHVLHRLQMPRHPPCALRNLTDPKLETANAILRPKTQTWPAHTPPGNKATPKGNQAPRSVSSTCAHTRQRPKPPPSIAPQTHLFTLSKNVAGLGPAPAAVAYRSRDEESLESSCRSQGYPAAFPAFRRGRVRLPGSPIAAGAECGWARGVGQAPISPGWQFSPGWRINVQTLANRGVFAAFTGWE
jgi:hypothetical protein